MDTGSVDSLKITSGLCAFSRNGLYIAVANHQRLNVYPAKKSAKTLQIFTCSEPIQYLEWSTDSELLLTSSPLKGKVEVWSIHQPEWRCKISLGQEGLLLAFFAPGSRHIMTISDFYLRLTIWSLVDRTVRHINFPKEANPGLDFSPGGSLMAVVERRSGKEVVGIYSCEAWRAITVINPDLLEISGIQWSPDSSKIAIWSELYPCKLVIYSVAGRKVAEFGDNGYCNIRSCLWSSTSQLLAIYTSKSSVKLLNHVTWDVISTLTMHSKVHDGNCIVYEEKAGRQIEYEVNLTRPVNVSGPRDSTYTLRRKGPQIAFSSNSRYLAVVDEMNPKAVWIWEMPKLSLKSVLIHKEAVKCFKWGPKQPRLALCCGSPLVFFWTPLGCAVMNLKEKITTLSHNSLDQCFPVENLEWSISGHALLIAGKDTACLHFFESHTATS